MLEPRLGALAALAGRLRAAVSEGIARDRRRAFWHWVFAGAPRTLHAAGREQDAAALVKSAIAAGGADQANEAGFVSLVGAGPGSRDLLTLRAVERLQAADVIFYDRLVDVDVLELARRDAERTCVGKAPGAHSWPQDRINGVIAASARAGRKVVRLKCGDPGIFGRVAEEIAALESAGVAWEIVPGITAASAAAACTGSVLTERRKTDVLVLATARSRDGEPDPDLAARLLPGTTLAIYMGVSRAAELAGELIAAGHSPNLPVEIVHCAEKERQRLHSTDLARLHRDGAQVPNPAMIFIRSPRQTAAATASATVRTGEMKAHVCNSLEEWQVDPTRLTPVLVENFDAASF